MTPTALPGGGRLEITELHAVPNPVTAGLGHLRVLLQGPAARLRLRIYSVAWQRVAEFEASGGGPGWVDVPFTAGALPRNGLFYVEARALAGAAESPWALTRVWLAR